VSAVARGAEHLRDPAHRAGRGVDVDAGVAIGEALSDIRVHRQRELEDHHVAELPDPLLDLLDSRSLKRSTEKRSTANEPIAEP
jgi:hypothetical protein